MQILLLTSSYPPVLGGLQTATSALACEWQKMGHIVHVVTQRYPRSLAAFEVIDGIPVWRNMFLTPRVEYLKSGRMDLFFAGLYYRIATQLWLARKILAFQPDVINVHFPDSQTPFVLSLKKKTSSALVVSVHGNEILQWSNADDDLSSSSTGNSKLHELNTLFQEADAVTACSQYLLDKTIEIFPAVSQKGSVVHNGVSHSRFHGNRIYKHTRSYCFAYGRLTAKKGFDLLVKAFAEAAIQFPGLDLIIAGDGEEKNSLTKMVDELGLRGRVIFFGRATPEQVVELLNGCEVLIIPSRVEPFGIIALEGLIAGKPIVATRVGGLLEILDRTFNQLVNPTVEGLTSGIEKMAFSKDRELIARQNKMLALNFSWNIASKKYLKIFSDPCKLLTSGSLQRAKTH
jgi:glycosyltransferase involved in cell wall biosynthesis